MNLMVYGAATGSAGIYGTYEISILGRALINDVTSAISWSGFAASSVTHAVAS